MSEAQSKKSPQIIGIPHLKSQAQLFRLLIALLISFSHLMHTNLAADVCFTPFPANPFPKVIGGADGPTNILCADYDSTNGKVLMGGFSESDDMISGGAPIPILIQMDDATGSINWHKQVQVTGTPAVVQEDVQICKYSDDVARIVTASLDPFYSIMIFDSSDGNLLKSFYEEENGNKLQRTPVGIELYGGILYLVSTQNLAVFVSAFDPFQGPPLTTMYYRKHQDGDDIVGASMVLEKSEGSIYVGGSANGDLMVMKLDITDGYYSYIIGATSSDGNGDKLITALNVNNGDADNIVTCAENLGTSTYELGIIYFTGTLQPSIDRSWYIESPVQKRCSSIKLINQIINLVAYEEGSHFLFAKFDITGDPGDITFTKVKVGADGGNLPYATSVLTGGVDKFFYAGSTTQVITESYSQSTGFLNKYTVAGCLPDHETVSYAGNQQSNFGLLQYISSPTDLPDLILQVFGSEDVTYHLDAGLETIDLLQTDIAQLPELNNCLTYAASGDITPSTVDSPKIYVVKDPTLTSTFPHFSYSQNCVDLEWTYSATLFDGSPLPVFIQFTQTTSGGEIKVQTDNNLHIGIYNVKIIGSLPSDQGSDYFNLQIRIEFSDDYLHNSDSPGIPINNNAPLFEKSPLQDKVLDAGVTGSYRLPQFYDLDGDGVKLTIKLNGDNDVPPFVTLNRRTITFKPSKLDFGVYNISVILNDTNPTPKHSLYPFILVVNEVKDDEAEDQGNEEEQDPSSQASNPDFKAEISSITFNGEMTIEFTKEVVPYRKLKDINESVLKIFVERPQRDDIKEWYVTEFKETQLKIQLQFHEPNKVSQFDKDQVFVQVLNNNFFVERETQALLPKNQVLQSELPPQISREDGEVVKQIANVVENALNSVIVGSLALRLAVSASVQTMWGMVNTLQLIVHIPLFRIFFPSNTQQFLSMLLSVLTFDFYNFDNYHQVMFNLKDEDEYGPYRQRFEYVGYDTTNLIYNMDTSFVFIYAFPVLVIAFFLIRLIKVNIIKKIAAWLGSFLFFNGLFRYLIESCLESTLSSILILQDSHFDTYGEIIAYVFSPIYLAGTVALTIMLPVLLYRNRENYNVPSFQYRYCALTEGLREHVRGVWIIHSMFIARRMLFCGIVFVLRDYLVLQIWGFIILSLGSLCYIIHAHPFQSKMTYYLEVFNEASILAISYILISFTDVLQDYEIKYGLGWLFIVIFVLNIAVNVCAVIYDVVVTLRLHFKRLVKIIKSKLRKIKVKKVDQKPEAEEQKLSVIEEQDEENLQTDQNNNPVRLHNLVQNEPFQQEKRNIKRMPTTKITTEAFNKQLLVNASINGAPLKKLQSQMGLKLEGIQGNDLSSNYMEDQLRGRRQSPTMPKISRVALKPHISTKLVSEKLLNTTAIQKDQPKPIATTNKLFNQAQKSKSIESMRISDNSVSSDEENTDRYFINKEPLVVEDISRGDPREEDNSYIQALHNNSRMGLVQPPPLFPQTNTNNSMLNNSFGTPQGMSSFSMHKIDYDGSIPTFKSRVMPKISSKIPRKSRQSGKSSFQRFQSDDKE